jgi:hypothetical protein
MLADACHECTMFIRFLDQDGYDVAAIVDQIQVLVGRLHTLFLERQCLSRVCFTSVLCLVALQSAVIVATFAASCC